MTPTQLRAFHAVASTGSFTAAARALHTSQPPITTHVRELEERYGVELFHRHGRGAELTSVGRKLLAITQRVIANHEEAVELLQDAGRLKSGHLHLGVIAPFGITALLARFREVYPQILVTATPGNSSELLEGLRRYRLDVALVGQVSSLEEFHTTCHTQPEIVLLVHRRHRWARRRAIRIRELAGEPLIFREQGSNTQLALQTAASAAGVTLQPAMTYGSREGVVALVGAGLGVAPLPEDQFNHHPELRIVRIEDVRVRVDSYLACLAERSDSRVVKAFIELAEQVIPGVGKPVTGAGTP
jgi:aminoethylphosphonate catabolism LysR family transcriptional regulator